MKFEALKVHGLIVALFVSIFRRIESWNRVSLWWDERENLVCICSLKTRCLVFFRRDLSER